MRETDYRPISSDEDKYSFDEIMNKKKIQKAQTRWNQVEKNVALLDGRQLDGPILDCGAGNGYFLLEGLKRDRDVWGVDMAAGKVERFRKMLEYRLLPANWCKRYVQGDGYLLPFRADNFSIVTSWWVLEHVAAPLEIVTEMIRVTRPQGVIVIRAQNPHCGWEGHCKIPWLPLLPAELQHAWIEEFEVPSRLRDGVYDISQEDVVDMLSANGCTIVKKESQPPLHKLLRSSCPDKQSVRKLARKVRAAYREGKIVVNTTGHYIYAQKR
jgi:ubiquinone/menaquinone biosynthesis C-methylase UbiE